MQKKLFLCLETDSIEQHAIQHTSKKLLTDYDFRLIEPFGQELKNVVVPQCLQEIRSVAQLQAATLLKLNGSEHRQYENIFAFGTAEGITIRGTGAVSLVHVVVVGALHSQPYIYQTSEPLVLQDELRILIRDEGIPFDEALRENYGSVRLCDLYQTQARKPTITWFIATIDRALSALEEPVLAL
jgi:hypothetical protein